MFGRRSEDVEMESKVEKRGRGFDPEEAEEAGRELGKIWEKILGSPTPCKMCEHGKVWGRAINRVADGEKNPCSEFKKVVDPKNPCSFNDVMQPVFEFMEVYNPTGRGRLIVENNRAIFYYDSGEVVYRIKF